jgi:hypothetical protein
MGSSSGFAVAAMIAAAPVFNLRSPYIFVKLSLPKLQRHYRATRAEETSR